MEKDTPYCPRRTFLAGLAASAALFPAARAFGAERPPRTLVLGEARSIRSTVLSEERSFRFHFAPGARDLAASGAPVCVYYVIDGERLFEPVCALCDYYCGGKLKPRSACAVVGVDTGETRARLRDLTPTASGAGRDGRSPPGAAPQGGGAARFLRYLREELTPQAEALLPAGIRPARRALLGHSLGGLFTLSSVGSGSKFFEDFAAADASLWWDAGSALGREADRLSALPPGSLAGTRVIAGFATAPRPGKELHFEQAGEFERVLGPVLRRLGARLEARLCPEETHATVALPVFALALKRFILG